MLKWVFKINFKSSFLQVMTGTATLINADFTKALYEELIILNIKKEPGCTTLNTKYWKEGFIISEDGWDFLKTQLDSYYSGLILEKECHFWFPNYLQQKEDEYVLSKIKEIKRVNKEKTKRSKRTTKEITRITKNKKQ